MQFLLPMTGMHFSITTALALGVLMDILSRPHLENRYPYFVAIYLYVNLIISDRMAITEYMGTFEVTMCVF